MSSLDMSLDDIAKANRSSRVGRGGSRGGRGGRFDRDDRSSGPLRHSRHTAPARQNKPYQRQNNASAYVSQPLQFTSPLTFAPSAAPVESKWSRDLFAASNAVATEQKPQEPVKKIQGDTIHVSNLAPDVTDDDVREIFERIGTVKSVNVNFNSQGQSTGTATLTFAKKTDAEKAVNEYDEAEVDGRVMKLKLIGSIVTAPVVVKKKQPAAPAVVPAAAAPQLAFLPAQSIVVPQSAFRQQQHRQTRQVVSRPRNAPRPDTRRDTGRSSFPSSRGGRGGSRGGAGAGSSRGGARPQRKELTADDLDKEMNEYHSASTVDAAAAGQPTSV